MNTQDLIQTARIASENQNNPALAILLKMLADRLDALDERN